MKEGEEMREIRYKQIWIRRGASQERERISKLLSDFWKHHKICNCKKELGETFMTPTESSWNELISQINSPDVKPRETKSPSSREEFGSAKHAQDSPSGDVCQCGHFKSAHTGILSIGFCIGSDCKCRRFTPMEQRK